MRKEVSTLELKMGAAFAIIVCTSILDSRSGFGYLELRCRIGFLKVTSRHLSFN